MFSGIVQYLGSVVSLLPQQQGALLTLASEAFQENALAVYPLRKGDSVAISGVCLTVVDFCEGEASFDIGSETLRRTNLGGLNCGDPCHIERSLRLGDSLDGHLVFGHVDATTELLSAAREGDTLRLVFRLPQDLAHLVAAKGSVAIDGVSLTIGELTEDTFSVYVIPHTLERTKFGSLIPGASINIEADMLARYVARILERPPCLP